jgi:hypothetical protein
VASRTYQGNHHEMKWLIKKAAGYET